MKIINVKQMAKLITEVKKSSTGGGFVDTTEIDKKIEAMQILSTTINELYNTLYDDLSSSTKMENQFQIVTTITALSEWQKQAEISINFNETKICGQIIKLNCNVKKITCTIKASEVASSNLIAITNDFILADSVITLSMPVGSDDESYEAIAKANIICVNQVDGSLTLKLMGTVPAFDVNIDLIVNRMVSNS